MAGLGSQCKSGCRTEISRALVEQVQHAVRDGEIGSAQSERTVSFLFTDTGEASQVGKADLDRGKFHRALGLASRRPEITRDGFAHIVEHIDPVRDESALAGFVAMQILGQRSLAAAAHAMAHDDDLANIQELDCKFQRRRYAVAAGRGLERRDQRGHIADDKNLAGIDVEYLRRIDPAVRTGDHHDLRRLPDLELFPAVVLIAPCSFAETAIAVNEFIEAFHADAAAWKWPLSQALRANQPWVAGAIADA